MKSNKLIKVTVCAFCGRSEGPHEYFFGNTNARMILDATFMDHVRICPECAKLACAPYLLEQQFIGFSAQIQPPEWIEHRLSEAVIGQSGAKRVLAIAAWQHTHRRSLSDAESAMLPKHNVFIVGPTGTGKTLLLETLAQILDVPMITFDTSTVTKAGYIGAKARDCVQALVTHAGSVTKAEFGIIHLDEIDKICRAGVSGDVGGEAAQQSFLKILEGMTLTFGKESFSTKNILFVATGAFPDLYEKHSMDTRGSSMGFSAQPRVASALTSVTFEQLTKFGMIPEFMRRFPLVTLMQPLTVEDLIDIMYSSTHSPLEQYSKLFATMGVTAVWRDDFVVETARRAYEKRIGASGIASVLGQALLELLFVLPGMVGEDASELTITFTPEFLDGGSPEYVFEGSAASGGE